MPGTIIAARSADVGPCVGRDVRSSVFASRRASCQARPLALCSSGPDDEITGPTQPATGGSRHGHGPGPARGRRTGGVRGLLELSSTSRFHSLIHIDPYSLTIRTRIYELSSFAHIQNTHAKLGAHSTRRRVAQRLHRHRQPGSGEAATSGACCITNGMGTPITVVAL